MKKYSAKAIANAFLNIAEAEGAKIAPMKIQKLVYIAHGWALGLLGEPLIAEDVQAWKYGPVIPNLYHEFKRFGSSFITSKATDISLDSKTLKLIEKVPEVCADDQDANELIRRVWDVYGGFSGPELSNLTHMPDTPWDKIFNGEKQNVIPNSTIKSHYEKLIRDRRKQ